MTEMIDKAAVLALLDATHRDVIRHFDTEIPKTRSVPTETDFKDGIDLGVAFSFDRLRAEIEGM